MKEFLKSVKKRYIILAVFLLVWLIIAVNNEEKDQYHFQQPRDQIVKIELWRRGPYDTTPPVLCKTIEGEDIYVFMRKLDFVSTRALKRHKYDMVYSGSNFIRIYYKNGDIEWIGEWGVNYICDGETTEILYGFSPRGMDELFDAELMGALPAR